MAPASGGEKLGSTYGPLGMMLQLVALQELKNRNIQKRCENIVFGFQQVWSWWVVSIVWCVSKLFLKPFCDCDDSQ